MDTVRHLERRWRLFYDFAGRGARLRHRGNSRLVAAVPVPIQLLSEYRSARPARNSIEPERAMKKRIFGMLLASGLGMSLVVGSAAVAGDEDALAFANDDGGPAKGKDGGDKGPSKKGKDGDKGKGGEKGKGKGKGKGGDEKGGEKGGPRKGGDKGGQGKGE